MFVFLHTRLRLAIHYVFIILLLFVSISIAKTNTVMQRATELSARIENMCAFLMVLAKYVKILILRKLNQKWVYFHISEKYFMHFPRERSLSYLEATLARMQSTQYIHSLAAGISWMCQCVHAFLLLCNWIDLSTFNIFFSCAEQKRRAYIPHFNVFIIYHTHQLEYLKFMSVNGQ
jgi:hypothetical protein